MNFDTTSLSDIMLKTLFSLPVCLLLFMSLACAQSPHIKPASQSHDALARGFVDPPDSARPRTWWHWVSGNVTKEGITADLEAMKRIGLGGAQCFSVDQIVDPKFKGDVLYMSPAWRELTKHAISECDRLGLELTIHACEGWSESGGPWITPADSMQKVVWTETAATGPGAFNKALPRPEATRDYYRDICVLAFPALPKGNGEQRVPDIAARAAYASRVVENDSARAKASPASIIALDQIVDLTGGMKPDGTLDWDVPAGQWTILRIGHTSTGKENAPAMPETRGLECDKLSRDAVMKFFNKPGMLGTVIEDSRPLMGRGLQYVLMDSWEAGQQNWTPTFREEFKRLRGYDPLPWLPALSGRYIASADQTERFLWDFRRTIADLIAENHYALMRSMLHDHNLKLTSEAVGIAMPTVADELECKGRTDVPMGEFWVGWQDEGSDTKEAASAAHAYGKTFAAAEAFTAVPEQAAWRNDPYSLKIQGDGQFCAGINRFVFHRYAHQPWLDRAPGMTMGPWGINFERTNTWWEPAAAWITYLSRCQFLLQQGLFVADFAYLYPEGAPRHFDRAKLSPPPPAGHDDDAVNAEVVLTRMQVKDGRIVLPDGMSYRALVLPQVDRMTPKLLEKIRQLIEAGATVVGPRPERSPSLSGYPACDEQVKQLARAIWGNIDGKTVTERRVGAGRIVWGRDLADVLGVPPDFVATGPGGDTPLRYIHRRAGDCDIYFISNQRNRGLDAECTFRVEGKVPELWHADTGRMETASLFTQQEGRTTVPIRFEPSGSVFVVFARSSRGVDAVKTVMRAGESMIPARPRAGQRGSLVIQKAIYGVLAGPAGQQRDVTSALRDRVQDGTLAVIAGNGIAGDPAQMIRKQLRVDYVLNGKQSSVTVNEGDPLEIPQASFPPSEFPAVALRAVASGRHRLTAFEPGQYVITSAAGKSRSIAIDALPAPLSIAGPWRIVFPPKLGAPPEATLDRLISWTESSDEGVRYFSGTATYSKEIDVPAEWVGDDRAIVLDLGEVKNLARVSLNGKDLGVLWKAPFRVDITSAARPGRNTLEVKVTNLWPNRLIGDSKLPEGQRVTWTSFSPYKSDSPLLPSGLLGPVTVHAARIADVSMK